jgi:hypothetical protein
MVTKNELELALYFLHERPNIRIHKSHTPEPQP